VQSNFSEGECDGRPRFVPVLAFKYQNYLFAAIGNASVFSKFFTLRYDVPNSSRFATTTWRNYVTSGSVSRPYKTGVRAKTEVSRLQSSWEERLFRVV